jgi:F-type H+-transporting ATPase subunit b
MGGLGINLPGLITQLVSFLIIFFLLYKFAYGPIIRMLDQRSQRIKASLEAAEEARKQAASSAERVEQELAAARQEGQKLIGEAREAAGRYREQEQAKARQEIEQMRERAVADISRERDAALEELRREFADLAVTAAERVVERSLDRKAHAEVIDRVLREGLEEAKN